MKLLPRPLGGSRLTRDYLGGVEAATSFYRGSSPHRAETYRRKARELDRARGPGTFPVARRVVRPAGPEGAALLGRVVAEDGYFVTTGQQPGLFGGPLYSLYKALTAERLARDLERLLDRPVMPLFWVASDDHDWEEANHAFVVDGSNRLVRLSAGALEGPPRPLGHARLGPAVTEALDRLGGSFPPNDFHAGYVARLRDAYRPGATMAAAFSGFMAELLRETSIGLVDAGDPELKEACRPVFRAEAEDPAGGEDVLRETAEALRSDGYALQVPLIARATNLFVDLADGRERLRATGGGFRLGRSGGELSRRRLFDLIEHEPGSVSPNVLLRPVMESVLFPTLAYVGGPAEVAYFAQLGGLFRRHGVGMPVVFPRGSLLALETRVAKILDKFGLATGDLRDAEALLSRFARDQLPAEVRGAAEAWREAVESRGGELADAAATVDPGLRGAVMKARNAGLAALGSLEKKIVRAVKRNAETTRAQIVKAQVNLWPNGKPQDRVLCPPQYLMRYGPGFPALALRRIHALSGPTGESGGFAARDGDSVV